MNDAEERPFCVCVTLTLALHRLQVASFPGVLFMPHLPALSDLQSVLTIATLHLRSTSFFIVSYIWGSSQAS